MNPPNTPKLNMSVPDILPQATSTVDSKKRFVARTSSDSSCKPEKLVSDDSRESLRSESSLGILSTGDMADFSVSEKSSPEENDIFKKPNPITRRSSDASENLRLQQKLALQTLEKSSSEKLVDVKPISALPSYLLEPKMTRDNSTGAISNASSDIGSSFDFGIVETPRRPERTEKTATVGINSNRLEKNDYFNASEISGRSSSASDLLNDKQIDRVRDKLQTQLPEITYSLSPNQERKSINSLDSRFSSVSEPQFDLGGGFLSGDQALEKLKEDELSWQKTKAVIPKSDHGGSNQSEVFSSFSQSSGSKSFFTDSSKVSIGEFFLRKTENLENLHLQPSPVKLSRQPVPLIDETSEPENSSFSSVGNWSQSFSDLSLDSTQSISVMGITAIQENIRKLKGHDTKDIIDVLLNKRNLDSLALNESATLENSELSRTLLDDRTELCPSRTRSLPCQSSTNSERPDEVESSQVRQLSPSSAYSCNYDESTRKNNSETTRKILKDTSYLQNIENNASENEETNFESNNRIDTANNDNNTPSIRKTLKRSFYTSTKTALSKLNECDDFDQSISDANDGWITPERIQLIHRKRSPQNLAESTSNNADSLDSSDSSSDNSIVENIPTDQWLRIKSQKCKACTNAPTQAVITLESCTNRWILAKYSVESVQLKSGSFVSDIERVISIGGKTEDTLIKPITTIDLQLNVMTHVAETISVQLEFTLKDMVTNAEKIVKHSLTVESLDSKIFFTGLKDNQINFELVGENWLKFVTLRVCNAYDTPVNLRFCISNEDPNQKTFFIVQNEDANSKTQILSSEIKPNDFIEIRVGLNAPKLSEILAGNQNKAEITESLLVYAESVLLRTLDMVATVGLVKLQFRSKYFPMTLKPGEYKTLEMKNAGVVPLELTAVITDDQQICEDNMFVIEPDSFILNPGEEGCAAVIFLPNENSAPERNLRTLELRQPMGSGFSIALEGVMSVQKKHSPLSKSKKGMLMCWGRQDSMSPSRNTPSSSSSSPVSSRGPVASSSYFSTKPGLQNVSNSSHKSSSQSGNLFRSETYSSLTSSGSSNPSIVNLLQNNKLPIDTTKNELVWGVVKPDKYKVNDFVIRNKAPYRIKIRAQIEGNRGFKFGNDQAQNSTEMCIILQANESLTIKVIFAPIETGPAIGKVKFLPYEKVDLNLRKQVVNLYAYGGVVSVEIQGTTRDVSGQMWLSLGSFDGSKQVLEQTFTLKNIGTITAFAKLQIIVKGADPSVESSLTISPQNIILEPNSTGQINICFNPKSGDLKKLMETRDICLVASVNIMFAAEIIRYRLRRLYKMINENIRNSIFSICDEFPGEHEPEGIELYKESGQSSFNLLCKELSMREVNLTVERNPDMTLMAVAGGSTDETCIFMSFSEDQSTLVNVPSSLLESPRRQSTGWCRIEPSEILLTIPNKLHDTILIISLHSREMHYEVRTEPSGILDVSPAEGSIAPRATSIVEVECSRTVSQHIRTVVLKIYVENEVMALNVNIHSINTRMKKYY